jgi:ankyrin repeat protein
MVSALWNASSEGNVDQVLELLKDATNADIEIKGMWSIYHRTYVLSLRMVLYRNHLPVSCCARLDHDGATPLIEALKNGHVAVVRALLDRGQTYVINNLTLSILSFE